MIGNRITYRKADGVRIPGTWRHAFICNGGTFFLTDLVIYADGLIDCWGLVTIDEFEQKLGSGWVATDLPEGAEASAHGLASWSFAEPRTWITPELLLAEVRDTIDELNGRPDSTARCLAAVDVFLADRTEENRAAALAAYLAIPETQRRYALGDMDRKDWPLQVLVAGPGGVPDGWSDEPVSQEVYDEAVTYFEERARLIAERPSRVPADGPATPHAPAVHLYHSYPRQRVDDPGKVALRSDYPASINIEGIPYSSVAHAYWALSVDDSTAQAAIAAADTSYAARKLAADATQRAGWEHARSAVMIMLLRAKYAQNPDLAEVLLATDDATLIYDDADSPFWGDNAGRGRNWAGRLLELVRSELHAQRAGIV
ncbi:MULTISPECIES: NADAR family protein [unclassified Streptomyces]|uniref:NADAR family protein n=1 Tax=unclassified Streptomyces TaxID=2593676 RepID=UPI001BEC5502|nr:MULTISPECIES: NADAR family protein [unclassified Streptomyces]MBT2403674.1 NADAR family protein [Streptomyces sp. ISL-21]MBT2611269.1 NADAR family protein [Streptomyces sp. ISL-87]